MTVSVVLVFFISGTTCSGWYDGAVPISVVSDAGAVLSAAADSAPWLLPSSLSLVEAAMYADVADGADPERLRLERYLWRGSRG